MFRIARMDDYANQGRRGAVRKERTNEDYVNFVEAICTSEKM